MAIVQISRITNRKGLQENLPQLAGAELGWSIDERRLWIGNGTIQEGAPVIGNTEILTEFSDILAFQTNYTYKGEAAGYTVQTGPTPSTPISQSLQSWLDQFATVKDFGAVGDGVTDDTAAINRALDQLYCQETNPQIRRSLFFPAGVYIINETIIIPPFATLYGEGADNSIIQMAPGNDSALRAYVARTGDSLQQTGVNIGTNGATPPQHVTISNIKFDTLDEEVDVFLVEDAVNCTFQNVSFTGPLTQTQLNPSVYPAQFVSGLNGVEFASTTSLVCSNIKFDGCVFSGVTNAVNTDEEVQGITIMNSQFDTLYKGILLGTGSPVNGGPTGFKILHNVFDNIYAQAVELGEIELNATGYNIFYDVGNYFAGTTNPETSIISFGFPNNVSVGDMFQRTDSYATTYLRVDLNNYSSFAMTNSKQLALGSYVLQGGQTGTLVNNTASPTIITNLGGFPEQINTSYGTKAFTFNYSIVRDVAYRTGTITVASGASNLTYTDDYVENTSTGVTLSVTQASGIVSIRYTTNIGVDGTITYQVTRLN